MQVTTEADLSDSSGNSQFLLAQWQKRLVSGLLLGIHKGKFADPQILHPHDLLGLFSVS